MKSQQRRVVSTLPSSLREVALGAKAWSHKQWRVACDERQHNEVFETKRQAFEQAGLLDERRRCGKHGVQARWCTEWVEEETS
jgi:hypothetical protein